MRQNGNAAGGVNNLDARFRLDVVFRHIGRAAAQQVFVECFLKVFYIAFALKVAGQMRATENLVGRIGKTLRQFGHIKTLLPQQVKYSVGAGITRFFLGVEQLGKSRRFRVNEQPQHMHRGIPAFPAA